MHAPRRRPFPRLAAEVGAALLTAAFASWEGLQGRYSVASHASILAAIGVVLVLAAVSGRGRQLERSRTWARNAARALRPPRGVFAEGRARVAVVVGAAVWVLLIAVTVGWDATSFVEQRHDLPTLSRLFGDLTDHDWGRALVFAAWVVLGLSLATGLRRPRRSQTGTTGATRPDTTGDVA